MTTAEIRAAKREWAGLRRNIARRILQGTPSRQSWGIRRGNVSAVIDFGARRYHFTMLVPKMRPFR
jgi:hypothetical protein